MVLTKKCIQGSIEVNICIYFYIVCNYWLKYRPQKVVKKMCYVGRANIKKMDKHFLIKGDFKKIKSWTETKTTMCEIKKERKSFKKTHKIDRTFSWLNKKFPTPSLTQFWCLLKLWLKRFHIKREFLPLFHQIPSLPPLTPPSPPQ